MQHKARAAILALFMTSLVLAPIAEAKRAGGGRSIGMSRTQSTQTAPSYQQSNTYRSTQQQQPVQQQPRSGSNIGGMVAAGAAGAALGAMATHALADNNHPNGQAEQEKSGFSWFWLIILAVVGFFLFRHFSNKKKLATANPYAPNSGGVKIRQPSQSPFGQPYNGGSTNIFGQQIGSSASSQTSSIPNYGAYTASGNPLPDGTEPAAFLRFARQRFNHIQAMNSASNIEEIRRYFTPEMYQAIYSEIINNQEVAEFSNLTATVVEKATENGQYIVSVRFSGTVSEDLNSLPQPFSEIWHFVKAVGSQQDWLVAGIQQD